MCNLTKRSHALCTSSTSACHGKCLCIYTTPACQAIITTPNVKLQISRRSNTRPGAMTHHGRLRCARFSLVFCNRWPQLLQVNDFVTLDVRYFALHVTAAFTAAARPALPFKAVAAKDATSSDNHKENADENTQHDETQDNVFIIVPIHLAERKHQWLFPWLWLRRGVENQRGTMDTHCQWELRSAVHRCSHDIIAIHRSGGHI